MIQGVTEKHSMNRETNSDILQRKNIVYWLQLKFITMRMYCWLRLPAKYLSPINNRKDDLLNSEGITPFTQPVSLHPGDHTNQYHSQDMFKRCVCILTAVN